jgi:hypothetical protein
MSKGNSLLAIRPACFAALLLAGCQTLDPDWRREASTVIEGGGRTAIHELFPGVTWAAGDSGFRLLPDGVGAFVARVWLARSAGRTLDLQYYMINADDTGRLLTGEVISTPRRLITPSRFWTRIRASKCASSIRGPGAAGRWREPSTSCSIPGA